MISRLSYWYVGVADTFKESPTFIAYLDDMVIFSGRRYESTVQDGEVFRLLAKRSLLVQSLTCELTQKSVERVDDVVGSK